MNKTHSMRCLGCGKPMPSAERGLAELCPKCLKDKANQLRRHEKLRTVEDDRMEFLRKIINK